MAWCGGILISHTGDETHETVDLLEALSNPNRLFLLDIVLLEDG